MIWTNSIKTVYLLNFYYFHWAIYFSLLPIFLFSRLLPSPMVPMLPISLEDLVFFYFSCRLDRCMSLLGSSLLYNFSGIVICGLFSLCFMYKSHLWVSTYDICFSGSGLPHSIWCFIHLSICPQISRWHYFFSAV